MSLGKISSKTDILQDPFVTGQHYTGVSDLGFGGGQYVKYGFVLAKTTEMAAWIVKAKQVVLSLNPQSISQSEPAATNITYTQNAGRYIERHGQISKTITIQGTTGYTPTPKVPDAIRSTLPQPTIVTQEGPQSGLAQFLTLRALFREYWQNFSDDAYVEERSKTLLIWINGKDDETWVVEPMDFSMSRSAPGNKFTYQYSITMQTVAPVEAMVFDPDILTDFQKLGNIVNQVNSAFNTMTTAATTLGNAEATLAGAARDALGTVTSLMQGIIGGLQAVATGTKELIALPKLFVGQMDDIKNSFMGAWGQLLDVADYTQSLYGADPLPFEVHSVLTQTAELIADLSARKELFSSDFPSTWSQTLANYDPGYGIGGYNRDLMAPLQKGGVQETTILPGDTLQNIAIREMGNAERFMELVVLNSLKPPYISPSQSDRAPNTLAPGDPILIPATGSTSGARALVRTTVFTDPNFTSLVTGLPSPNVVQIDTRGQDFRVNQWAGFTLALFGPCRSTGGYAPPAGTYTTTLTAPLTSAGAGFGGTHVTLAVPPSALSTLPSSGWLIFAPGTPTGGIAVSYAYNPNLLDAISSANISRGTDALSNTTGFSTTAGNAGALSGPGAIYGDTTAGCTLSSSTTVALEETRSLHAVSNGSVHNSGFRTVSIPVQPSTTYTFSANGYGNGSNAVCSVWCVDNQQAPFFDATFFMYANSWTGYVNSFTTNANTTSVQFFFLQSGTTPFDAFFDSFQLELGGNYTVWNSAGISGYIAATLFYNLPVNYPTGTSAIYSVDGSLPPNSLPPPAPFDGAVGVIVSNDANTLTVDTNPIPAGGPQVGDMARIYLVRNPNDVAPRKSSQEQLLGVDLRMANNDLVVDAAGRLSLIDSTDNITQAIITKTKTRPGDLAAHPSFGLAFDPGTRMSPNLLFTYKVAIKQTLLSDARIDSVEQLGVVLDRDVLRLTGYVVLVGSSQPYALDTRGAS